MKPEAKQKLNALLERRWAALATLEDHQPFASWAAFAFEREQASFCLHLSDLAQHTRNIQKTPRVSLSVCEPDDGGDPQLLARVSVQGELAVVSREQADYARLKQIYLAQLPDAEPLFEFADFRLYRLLPDEVRYVAGFAQAFHFDLAKFRSLF
jgi:putative heme iron utilization protein